MLPRPANETDFVFNAQATPGDGFSFTNTGAEIVLFRNVSGGALTYTIDSATYLGREGDIGPYSVGAGEFAVEGPFPMQGFNRGSRKVELVTSAVGLEVAVLRLPHIS